MLNKMDFLKAVIESDFKSKSGYERHFTYDGLLFQFDETEDPTMVYVGEKNTETCTRTGHKAVVEVGWTVSYNGNSVDDGFCKSAKNVPGAMWKAYKKYKPYLDHLAKKAKDNAEALARIKAKYGGAAK